MKILWFILSCRRGNRYYSFLPSYV